MEAYRIENLSFTYPCAREPALAGISLTIEGGSFVTLCGASGCGKTTLLRQLKPALAPHGKKSGMVYFEGRPLDGLPLRDQSAKIGYVLQSPENQVVTEKVWHELAFGLESLGLPTPEIRLRVAEMASFFGIQAWFHKDVSELSGGQKQLLNLASIMAMQPSALILDEPTSQLDPIAASELLAAVGKINRELGVTVILTEHRLEEALPMSDRVIVMESGQILFSGAPQDVCLRLRERGGGMFLAMPAAVRIWGAVECGPPGAESVPITVRDGARWLETAVFHRGIIPMAKGPAKMQSEETNAAAVVFDDVWFKYEKFSPDVIRGLSFTARYGELTAILGGNGTGKTTALSLASRLNTPYRGKVFIDGQDVMGIPRLFDNLLGVLPQDPQSLFVKKTVGGDLLETLSGRKLSKEEKERHLAQMSALCRLGGMLGRHPYDLSGGEQQRAALAKVLLLQPKILMLDEPTKGLDAEFKLIFAGILRKLAEAGVAVVMVSHDIEFCAEHAARCALFFDGAIVSEGPPHEFFSGNSFYTTSVNRMARRTLPWAVTAGDVVAALGGDMAILPIEPETGEKYEIAGATAAPPRQGVELTAQRKIMGFSFALLFIATVIFAGIRFDGLKAFASGGNEAETLAKNTADARLYVGIMLSFAVSITGLTLTFRRGKPQTVTPPAAKLKLMAHTIASTAILLILVPLTIFVGFYYLGDRKYYFISMLIIFETMASFALAFESHKHQARELVAIAVLCGVAVAGRVAFFMLPQFKPALAVVIITGVALGGESGFLVGAMTGFVSNIFFGQGPWTPWQMFAFGVIGFLAGILSRMGLLRRSPAPLAVFGAFAALAIYGGLMNPAMLLMHQTPLTRGMLFAAYLQGLPFDLVHASATAAFMLMISRSMLEKLDRAKLKYGLLE